MNIRSILCLVAAVMTATQALALSLAPEEFKASRDMACVLAQEQLGLLDEEEYGNRTHRVLDGFDDRERDTILAKALGYYDGLMFAIDDEMNVEAVERRLQGFVASSLCAQSNRALTVLL